MGFPVKPTKGEHVISLTTGWWIFKRTRLFIGSGTVWHCAYTGKRASTPEEMELADKAWLIEHAAADGK